MASTDDLLTDALRLPVEDRARLVHELLLSLDSEQAEPGAKQAWAQELERRAREVLTGAVQTEDAEEALDQISARLRARM